MKREENRRAKAMLYKNFNEWFMREKAIKVLPENRYTRKPANDWASENPNAKGYIVIFNGSEYKYYFATKGTTKIAYYEDLLKQYKNSGEFIG